MNITPNIEVSGFELLKIHSQPQQNNQEVTLTARKIFMENKDKNKLDDDDKEQIINNLSKLVKNLNNFDTHLKTFEKEKSSIAKADFTTKTMILNDMETQSRDRIDKTEKQYSAIKRLAHRVGHFFKGHGFRTKGEYGIHLVKAQQKKEMEIQKNTLKNFIKDKNTTNIDGLVDYLNTLDAPTARELLKAPLKNLNVKNLKTLSLLYNHPNLNNSDAKQSIILVLRNQFSPVELTKNLVIYNQPKVTKENIPMELVTLFKDAFVNNSYVLEETEGDDQKRDLSYALLSTRMIEQEIRNAGNGIISTDSMNLIKQCIEQCKKLAVYNSSGSPVNIHQDSKQFLSSEAKQIILDAKIMTQDEFDQAKQIDF